MNLLIRIFQDIGIQVDLKMKGYYDCEILRANGRIDRPWAKPQENAINPKFRDYM